MSDQNAARAPSAAEQAWLSARRQHVTSTDLPSILRLDDAYSSPIDVYLDKLGQVEPSEKPEFFEWGNRLQAAILAGYADREGVELEPADPHQLVEVPDFPLLAASLDARWKGGDRRCVDAKNVGWFRSAVWGEPYTDQIPTRFGVQLQVQMMATQTEVADLAVLFGGNRLVVYRVERDEAVQTICRDAAAAFWNHHVKPRAPPAIDGSSGWGRYLSTRAQWTEVVLDASQLPTADRWARALRTVQRRRATLEAMEEQAKNTLRYIIGENAGLKGEWGRLSYRQAKESRVLDREAYIACLEEQIRVLEPTAAGQLLEAARQRFTTTKPGARALRPTWAAESEPGPEDFALSQNEAGLDWPALPPSSEVA